MGTQHHRGFCIPGGSMLNLKAMNEAEITALYESSMRRDFPESELKSLSAILNMLRRDSYDVLGAYDGNQLIAYALVYRPREGRIALIDYLAVEPDSRNRGVGSMLLRQLRRYYCEAADVLMIECERPKAAPDEAEARKRIRFYSQSGAKLTNARILLFGVEYSIMALPCTDSLVECDWAEQMLTLYRQMLPKELYEQNVRLIRS